MKIFRNIISVLVGWIAGSAINMGLVKAGHHFYPIETVDPNDMEAMKAIMPTLSFEYFVFPFLAHAMGTLAGAFLAGLIASSRKMLFAMLVGGLFLIGGIMVNIMLTGPVWFTITDLLIAYIPMAWIGGKIATLISSK